MNTQIAEYSATAAALAELRTQYLNVTFDVSTSKGLDAAKKARAEIRGYRVALEKKRKEVKAPALERCKLIDDEAERITAELVALENPIDATIKAEETRKEQERQAREEQERHRIAVIQAKIAAITAIISHATGERSANLQVRLLNLQSYVPKAEEFQEFIEAAKTARTETLARLNDMLAAQLAHEEEQERIKAERAELAKLRAEQEAREREQKEREAAERARLDAEERARKARADAEEKARRDAIDAEERAARERIAEEERLARQARLAADREAESLRREEEDRQRVEREKLDAERREIEAKKAEAVAAAVAPTPALADPAPEHPVVFGNTEVWRSRNRVSSAAIAIIDAREMLETFVKKYGDLPEFAVVTEAIQKYFEVANVAG